MKIPYLSTLSEPYFIDRPAKGGSPIPYHIFKHVIALAIDPNYQYPKKYKSELNFYGMNDHFILYKEKINQIYSDDEDWSPTIDIYQLEIERSNKVEDKSVLIKILIIY